MTDLGIGTKPHAAGILEPRDFLPNASQPEADAVRLLNEELKRQVTKLSGKQINRIYQGTCLFESLG